ncbi:MAG TPA: DUF1501 domain-containing protein [Burkholderiaceae bacterium]|nr:DUF1501 domain-containing protein [Burkholderiaceae bacterium]
MTSRRLFLSAAALSAMPAQLVFAQASRASAPDDPRFVFVLLRGGMDGLGAVPAVGDAEFAAARGALADFGAAPLALPGTPFALHPNLASLHAMYQQGELAVVHATGLAYRERSHFDAQQVLESGGTRPYELSTGWLGRALAAQGIAPRFSGLALTTAVPLVLRGSERVDTWAPSALPEPSPDLVARLELLYVGDAGLREALARAKGLREQPGMAAAAGNVQGRQAVLALARKAGEMLAASPGPRIAVLELGGWDTHANQVNPNGALANNLRTLDAGLAALRDALGAAWGRSVVLVATEFGREVAINGTMGTDHGSGGAAFVAGGAVAGGRVITDWPGLARANRFEGRDLRVTTDLRALMKGVLADHLKIAHASIERSVLPGSGDVRPIAVLRA